jgi:hypothetical protein
MERNTDRLIVQSNIVGRAVVPSLPNKTPPIGLSKY